MVPTHVSQSQQSVYYTKVDLKHGLDRPVYYAIYKLSLGLPFYCVKSIRQCTMMTTIGSVSEIVENPSLGHA